MEINKPRYKSNKTKPRRWYSFGVFSFRFVQLILAFQLFAPSNSYCSAPIDDQFVFTESLQKIYKETCRLKIDEATRLMKKQLVIDPNNQLNPYIENYIDFFTLFIQEDAVLYKSLLPKREIRLNKIKDGNQNSPYYLYCQAEILLQWATIKLKFNYKTSAALDVYEAYKLLEKNKIKFPNFKENNKSLSIIYALSESVPNWLKKIIGIKGSVHLGTKEIEKLVNSLDDNSIYREEILAIYIYILFYSNNQKEKAYKVFSKYSMDHKSNLLVCFLKATITQKTGRNNEALTILEERPKGNEYLPFYYLDFMYGKYKLYRLDKDADIYLKKFIHNFKGQHYIKEAYQKLSWYELVIKGNYTEYGKYNMYCKLKGNKLIDEDIQAYKECHEPIPNPELLKSRLLYDGGYFVESNKLLLSIHDKINTTDHMYEYYYRLARTADAQKNIKAAVEYYKKTITFNDSKKYFACSAALHLGNIYEEMGKVEEANYYYTRCLNLNPEGYANSLHQKAKSGINRLKN